MKRLVFSCISILLCYGEVFAIPCPDLSQLSSEDVATIIENAAPTEEQANPFKISSGETFTSYYLYYTGPENEILSLEKDPDTNSDTDAEEKGCFYDIKNGSKKLGHIKIRPIISKS